MELRLVQPGEVRARSACDWSRHGSRRKGFRSSKPTKDERSSSPEPRL